MVDGRELEVTGVQTRHDSWVGKVATVYFMDGTRREFKAEKEIEYFPA